MLKKFEFLTSTRFWAMAIGTIVVYLKAKGFIGEEEMILVVTITGGFVSIRTIDRTSEIIGGKFE